MAFFVTGAGETVVRRVWQNIYGGLPQERPYPVALQATITDAQTTIDNTELVDVTDVGYGDILESEESGEQMFVRATSGTDITVIRGWNGTTAAATTAANSILWKNPRSTYDEVYDSCIRILRELPYQGVWSYGSVDVTLTQGDYYYTLAPAGGIDTVLHASWTDSDGQVFDVPVVVVQNETTNDATEVRFDRDYIATGETVTVFYRVGFADTFPAENEVNELVVLGATANTLASRMGARTNDPGRHTDRTVQPGQGGRDARWYQAEYYLAVKRLAAHQRVMERDRRGGLRGNRARNWRG